MMNRKYITLAKNTGLIIVGYAASKIVGVLALPFFTKWLSPSDYGVADILMAYVLLLTDPITLAIEAPCFIYPNGKPREKQKRYFSSALFFSLVLLGLALLLMFVCREIWQKSGDEAESLFLRYGVLIWVMVFFQFITGFMKQILRVRNCIGHYAMTGLVAIVSSVLFCLWALPRFGFDGYLGAMILSNMVVVVYMFVFGKMSECFSISAIRLRYYFQMLRYSLPTIPAPILFWVQSSSNRPLLGEYIGVAAVGIFGFASKLPQMIGPLADAFCRSWEISAIKEFQHSDYPQFYNRVAFVFFAGGILLVLSISVLNEFFFYWLVDPRYHEAIQYTPTVACGLFFSVIGQFLGVSFTVNREARKFLYSGVVSVMLAGIGNVLLIPVFGIWGATFTVLISSAGMMVVRAWMSRLKSPMAGLARYGLVCLLLAGWSVMYMKLPGYYWKICSLFCFILGFIVLFKKDFRTAIRGGFLHEQ